MSNSAEPSPLRRRAVLLATFLLLYVLTVFYDAVYCGIISVAFASVTRSSDGIATQTATILYVGLPALLLIAGMLIQQGRARYRLTLAARILSYLFLIFAVLDVAFVPAVAGMAGTHASLNIQFLMAISVLCWQLLVLSLARRFRRKSNSTGQISPWHRFLAAPVLLVMFWSVVAGVSAAIQAYMLAGGRPFCIATTGAGETKSLAGGIYTYGPIRSLEELRGVRLYTWQTGYKSTSHWYFNAILVVGAQEPYDYWNWSIRGMQFDRVARPNIFAGRLKEACQPMEGFLSRLPLF